MFLKTITLHGFKSFADPTRLDTLPGMTVIVGPNGCGKSNISDAIRWVLGEQSPKALRGGKMQDVIFQGSETRKAVPFCQVTLVFSDCEAQLGTQYHEVEISRKVTREGGSDYYLNSKVCRLKDIQALFMDTGVGQASYSFLMQGQIDQILSSNPLERRAIFEEAAGITRYKSQRKEALNKLNLVDQNLTRVTDIIEEISKRIGTLKRQASKAVRYERLRHRLTHLDIAWNAYQYFDLNGQSTGIRQRLDASEKKMKEIREAVEKLNQELAQRKVEKSDIFQTVENLRSGIYTSRSARENCANQEKIKRNRIEHLAERIGQLDEELTTLKNNESSIKDEDSAISEQMTTQHSAVGNAESEYKAWEKQLVEIDSELREKSELLRRQKVVLIDVEKKITHQRSLSTRLEVGLESYHSKHEELLQSYHASQSEYENLTRQEKSLLERLEGKGKEKVEVAAGLEKITASLAAAEELLKKEQSAFTEIEKQHTQLTAESTILDNLQKKLEGFGEGTKAILQGSLEALIKPDEVQLFSKHIQVDSDYQQFCETLLGTMLESLVYGKAEGLSPISRFLNDEEVGRASFLVPELRRQNGRKSKTPAAAPLRPASELVTTNSDSLEASLDDILQGSYYCETLEEAVNYLKANPGFEFEHIATRYGEIITRNGCVHLGKNSGKAGGFLQRQNELRKLKEQILEKEKSLKAKNEELEGLIADIENKRKEREEQRDILATVDREISNLQTEKNGIQRNLTSYKSRVETATKQLETLDLEKTKSESELSEVKTQLEAAEKTLHEQQTGIAELEQAVADLRVKKEGIFTSLSDAKVILSEEKQKLAGYQQTIVENRRRKEDLEQRYQQYQREQANARESIRKLEEEIQKDIAQAETHAAEIEKASAQLQKEEARFQACEEKIAEIEERQAKHLDTERIEQDELQKINVSLSEKEIYSRSLADKILEEYDLNLETVDWRLELWRANQRILNRVAIDDLEEDSDIADIAKQASENGEPSEEELAEIQADDWEETQNEIHTLRSKINSMGPVNTLAIEEYADLKERYEFLKSQSDDLWNSKNQLVEAIDEINKTSEELFRTTFDQIRTNFKDTYNRLTAGGESDLELIDAEDVLDSGIEIIARPPGTRLRNLTLLSGGQKTMTAVALLFAIYAVKPSPFCVLDELDAPLDDANIGRFVEMLKDFTRFSQFMIISHNKRTIAAADSIFGVTMEEKGVSKLLSMRFNSDKDLIENMVEI